MEILRYAAFTRDPDGGNPAGVVLDATGASDAEMQAAAADVGFSETAFLLPQVGGGFRVRYFSPLAEVPFCGHATIATAVAYAERHGAGELALQTQAGLVTVTMRDISSGGSQASLVSVPPRVEDLGAPALAELLHALRWDLADLDPALPVRVAYAGAFHPVIAAATRERLAGLDYDFPALQALMSREGWTTVDLVWRESERIFHSRNPFPPGGVVEDPATGAAAAALGGYLRALGLVTPPAEITVHQGVDLGRPGLLMVGIPPGAGGISVSGAAVRLP
jgi:PhzF family phenazine biosynthesis protein